MQLYVARDKVKSGPFTQFQVKEKLATGEISIDDLGWHEGLDAWAPLSEIPAAEEILKEVREEAQADLEKPVAKSTPPMAAAGSYDAELGCKQVRPVARFFARSLDIAVYSTVIWIILGGYPLPDLSGTLEEVKLTPEAYRYTLLVQMGIYLSWNFIEAYLLSAYGTTLGKALLRVEIRRQDGSLPDYQLALYRTFYVWLAGFAMGLPYLREFAQLICLGRLLRHGITPWDSALALRVRHRPIGLERVVAYAAILLTAVIGLTLASLP